MASVNRHVQERDQKSVNIAEAPAPDKGLAAIHRGRVRRPPGAPHAPEGGATPNRFPFLVSTEAEAARGPGSSLATKTGFGGRRAIGQWCIHLSLLGLGVGLLVLFIAQVDGRQMVEFFAKLDGATLSFVIVIYAFSWFFRTWRLRAQARGAAIALSWREATRLALGANALNILAPARAGDVGAFVRLREISTDGAGSAATVVAYRLADFAALAGLALLAGLAGLALAPTTTLPLGSLAWAAAAGGGSLLLFGIMIRGMADFRLRAILSRVASRVLGSGATTGTSFGRALAALFTPRLALVGLVLGALAWACDLLVGGAIVHATTGRRPDAFAITVVPFLLAAVAKILPTTPGGIGTFEGVFAASLHVGYNVPIETAVASAVAIHLFMNIFTLAFGVPGASRAGQAVSRAIAKRGSRVSSGQSREAPANAAGGPDAG